MPSTFMAEKHPRCSVGRKCEGDIAIRRLTSDKSCPILERGSGGYFRTETCAKRREVGRGKRELALRGVDIKIIRDANPLRRSREDIGQPPSFKEAIVPSVCDRVVAVGNDIAAGHGKDAKSDGEP